MKMKMTVRRRTKTDGISGIATVVKILADVQIGVTGIQAELEIPDSEYEQFAPGTQWETELVMLPKK